MGVRAAAGGRGAGISRHGVRRAEGAGQSGWRRGRALGEGGHQLSGWGTHTTEGPEARGSGWMWNHTSSQCKCRELLNPGEEHEQSQFHFSWWAGARALRPQWSLVTSQHLFCLTCTTAFCHKESPNGPLSVWLPAAHTSILSCG